MNKTNDNWITIAKGIGVIFVLIGHFDPVYAPEYWKEIIRIIYTFHMPLFFLLSGFLYNHAKYSYSELIKNKVKRLVYPFISIAIIFFVIKYLAGMFVELKYPVGVESIYALLVSPAHSYVPILWFVHILFFLFLVFPLFKKVIKNNSYILMIFVLIKVLLGEKCPVLGPLFYSMPFFIVGVILRENKKLQGMVIPGRFLQVGVSLVAFILLYFIPKLYGDVPLKSVYRLIIGVAGTVCIINISMLIDTKWKLSMVNALLMKIGFYSMTIYLFHTIFESIVRIGLYKVLGEFSMKFEVIAFTAIAAGIVFPLLLEKFFFRKNKVARKYILGLS